MFNWFKRLLQNEQSYELYHPEERLIYSYFDGQKDVKADPMDLYKKLMEVGPELSIELKVAASPMKDAHVEHTKAVNHIRQIFSLKTFSEGGLTQSEATDLLDHFLTFVGMLKKKGSPSPTSPDATSETSPPSLGGNPPTPSSFTSGSTAAENSTDVPNPPQSESDSDLEPPTQDKTTSTP